MRIGRRTNYWLVCEGACRCFCLQISSKKLQHFTLEVQKYCINQISKLGSSLSYDLCIFHSAHVINYVFIHCYMEGFSSTFYAYCVQLQSIHIMQYSKLIACFIVTDCTWKKYVDNSTFVKHILCWKLGFEAEDGISGTTVKCSFTHTDVQLSVICVCLTGIAFIKCFLQKCLWRVCSWTQLCSS